jgi:Fibronectin type III domain
LANIETITASGIVGLTWSGPQDDGGSSVINYDISYKFGTGAYTTLASGIIPTEYTAGSLTAGVVYTFKVAARNAIGLSPDSSEFT